MTVFVNINDTRDCFCIRACSRADLRFTQQRNIVCLFVREYKNNKHDRNQPQNIRTNEHTNNKDTVRRINSI